MQKYSLLLCAVFMAGVMCVSPSYAKSADDAKTYITRVAGDALAIIEKESDKQKKQKKLEKLFSDNVNINWVAKFVIGRYWKQATADQKKRYLHEYERFLMYNYASRFTDYTSGSFNVSGVRDDGEGEFTVSMSLRDGNNKNSEPVFVDYRVRAEGGRFRIFDVIVEGVSLITTQRSEFASVLSSKDIDYLIAQLASKSVASVK